MALDFELEKLTKELEERKPTKVLVQLPEGIKKYASEIQDKIEKLGIDVVFSGETAWGGCCINSLEAKGVNADLIVHFGHAKFIDIDFPILYIEIKDNIDLSPLLEKSLESLKDFEKIGLSFAVQHKDEIPKAIEFYKNHGKKIVMPEKLGHAVYAGHVIGCEFSGLKAVKKDVDAFIVIGNNFHSMGAALAVDKPIFLLDVYNGVVSNMGGVRDKILRQRIISIDKFKQAKNIGIIVESKPGQVFGEPEYLIEKIKAQGKNPHLIKMTEMTPDKILNFYNIEAFIVLACPRIPIDDYAKYERPLITFKEALIALGEKSFEDAMEEGLI